LYPAPQSRKRHNSARWWWTFLLFAALRCGTDRPSVVA